MPSVSVVMPVFNGERYLRDAVDSVLVQMLDDLELIVVNDGSTDGTAQILRTYDDPRLRVLNQPNSGIAVALNAGVDQARGPYVARMDADDISRPERLQRQFEFLETHPHVAAVGCSYVRIDELGRERSITATLCASATLHRMLFVHNPLGHGSTMVRTDVLREVGGYRPDRVPAEDYDLWIRISSTREIAALPEVLYEYRVHGASSVGEAQERMSLGLRNDLWAHDKPSIPSVRDVLDELTGYRKLPDQLGSALASEFTAGHYSLLREAVRRRRWSTVARLTTTAPYFVARQRSRRVPS